MKLIFKNIKESPVDLLRRCGYSFEYKRIEEWVFRRVLGSDGYPRFHIYASLDKSNLVVNLHLDAKHDTYGTATRHHGEYEDSQALEIEADRIRGVYGGPPPKAPRVDFNP